MSANASPDVVFDVLVLFTSPGITPCSIGANPFSARTLSRKVKS